MSEANNSMILRIVVLASVMALAHSQADGYYSASEPNTWVREAQREAKQRIESIEAQADATRVQSHHTQQARQIAQRKYHEAVELVSAREVATARTGFSTEAHRLKQQEQRLLKRALRLEKRALETARMMHMRGDTVELGEPRTGAETHSIRAAQMRGLNARWKMKAEEWQTGADRVKAALKASSEARNEEALQAINDQILKAKQQGEATVSKVESDEKANREKLVDAEKSISRAKQMKLSQQLYALRQRLASEHSASEQEWEAVRKLLPTVHSMDRDAVSVRASLEKVLSQQASLIDKERSKLAMDQWAKTAAEQPAETKRIDKIMTSMEEDTQNIKEMHKRQQEAQKRLKAAEEQEMSAEHDAIQLLTEAEHKLQSEADETQRAKEQATTNLEILNSKYKPHASKDVMLGEGSPRTELLAQSRAKRELKLMKRQQHQIVSQVRHHKEMKTKLLVKDTKIADTFKTEQLVKRVNAMKEAMNLAQRSLSGEKKFVEEEVHKKLEDFHKYAMQAVMDITEAISLE